MRKIAALGLVVAALTVSLPSVAKEMHCNMHKDHVENLDGKTLEQNGVQYQITVKDTFDKTPDTINSNDYNGLININWSDTTPGGARIKYRVRPRQSIECLVRIADETGNAVYSDMWCNTGKHMETAANFDITGMGDASNPYYGASAAVSTTSKVSHILSLYVKRRSGYVQIAGCIEDK